MRLPHLDGLRGIAILLVLITHAWGTTDAPALSFRVGTGTVVLGALPAVGYIGVSLFLVLSGFCLTWPFVTNPSARGRTSVLSFWRRRILRILPAYYASIVIVYALAIGFEALHARLIGSSSRWNDIVPHVSTVPRVWEMWSHALFIHNLFPDHVVLLNGSYWSLALEFQLYLLFPLAFEILLRWGPWRVLAFSGLVQCGYHLFLQAAYGSELINQLEFVLPKALPGRIFDFAAGMAAAELVAARVRSGRGVWLHAPWAIAPIAAALILAFVLTYFEIAARDLIDMIWATAFAALAVHAATQGGLLNQCLSWRPLVWLGVVSYSVYLLHQPLVERSAFIVRGFFRPGAAFLVELAMLAPIVVICAGFFYAVEAPVLRWTARQRSSLKSPR